MRLGSIGRCALKAHLLAVPSAPSDVRRSILSLSCRRHAHSSSTAKRPLQILEERGYVKNVAGDRSNLDNILASRQTSAYTGIDPTAPSLHLGHLIPLMSLFWLYAFGHHVTMLVGGGTARIGDPAGRLTARKRLSSDSIQDNAVALARQLTSLGPSAKRLMHIHGVIDHHLDKPPPSMTVDDNFRYLEQLPVVDFLGLVGTVARVGTMLGRDTVRTRLSDGDGMSFAEFTYPLIQAYDWWQLFRERQVQVQIGGSDQYGNIVAGYDVVKALASTLPSGKLDCFSEPVGMTTPLLTSSSGEKFGKSAGNAIWLDANKTTPFQLYGALLSTADADIAAYLGLLTFVPTQVIDDTMTEHTKNPSRRVAQHLLAAEVCNLVHGESTATAARNEHQSLRAPSLASLQGDIQSTNLTLPRGLVNMAVAKLLHQIGIARSNGEGARMIATGGVYAGVACEAERESEKLIFKPIEAASDPGSRYVVPGQDMMVLRIGKWDVKLVKIVD